MHSDALKRKERIKAIVRWWNCK